MEGIAVRSTISREKADVSVLRVEGYVDTTTANELERELQSLLEKDRYKIVIDLRDVDYISSAGWGIFISEIREIREHGGDLKLAGMVGDVYEVFELLEFQNILESFRNVDDAVNSF